MLTNFYEVENEAVWRRYFHVSSLVLLSTFQSHENGLKASLSQALMPHLYAMTPE